MTRTPRARRSQDDAAISSVLGAVLVFGLLLVTLLTVQVRFVPRWEEDREARHMDQVIDQLRVLKADLDRQAANVTTGQISDPLTLSAASGFRFLQSGGSNLGGDAEFAPSESGAGATITSPLLRILQRGGVSLYALNEVWASATTASVDDLVGVNHLRVRVINPNSETHGDFATVTVTDANGNYAGKAVITYLRSSSERSVQTEVYSAASPTTPITLQRESYFHQVDPPYIYVNLMDDELLFGQVMAAAAAPFDLDFTSSAPNALNVDYTSAYTTSVGGSVGSGGFSIPDFAQTTPSGRIVFASNNQQLPSQEFTVEHGAVILQQPEGSAVLVPPAFAVERAGSQAVIDWTLPALDGEGSALGGARAATVVANPDIQESFEGLAAQLIILLPTEHPDAWRSFFEGAFEAAGFTLTGATPEAEVVETANGIQLTVFGPVPNPADTTEDIVLHYRHAQIDLTLRPTG